VRTESSEHKTLRALLAYFTDMLSLMALEKLQKLEHHNPFADSHTSNAPAEQAQLDAAEHELVVRARSTIFASRGPFRQPLNETFPANALKEDFGGRTFTHDRNALEAYESASRQVVLLASSNDLPLAKAPLAKAIKESCALGKYRFVERCLVDCGIRIVQEDHRAPGDTERQTPVRTGGLDVALPDQCR
jgi:hypothetical protein